MKYKLLPTWEHVQKHGRQVEKLFREIETAGSPPTGVEGKRIVRGYRSEIDKKSMAMIAEKRKKIEEYFERDNQGKLENHLQQIRDKFDDEIRKLKSYLGAKGKFSREDRERFRLQIRELEETKSYKIRHDRADIKHIFEKELKLRVDDFVEKFKRRIAPRGFYWRLKFVIDTYGGRAYAGSMVVAIDIDPEGRGDWRKMGSVTSPT